MSKRLEILRQQTVQLVLLAREAKRARDDLRDNYVAKLAAAETEFADIKAERDEALARLNARLVADGQPEMTLQDFKDLP